MADLITSLNCTGEHHIIIDISRVSTKRINSIINAGAKPILIADVPVGFLPPSIQQYIKLGTIRHLERSFKTEDLVLLGRSECNFIVDKVFMNVPMSQREFKREVYQECRRLRIPIHVSDSREFSSFSILSTFTSGDFQMGVTTLGKGCKLSSRILREMRNTLPSNINEICKNIEKLRTQIEHEDNLKSLDDDSSLVGEHDEDASNSLELISLVKEFDMTRKQKKLQKMRWLLQSIEYFPLKALAELTLEHFNPKKNLNELRESNMKGLVPTRKGSISLVGAGPGCVSLLTLGSLHEIQEADLVLADKLIPQEILNLIPGHIKVFIARKFPGNAEKAQEQLLQIALHSLMKGERVVRLKQGDPYIFGRGGEEYKFFTKHGFIPQVFAGITSALAAPLLANISTTFRGVADQVLICTGTSKCGDLPNLPNFVPSRTVIFLMTLHRIVELVPILINEKKWDPQVPVAIIEKASCPDQRVIRTRLSFVPGAILSCNPKPPGLLVVGYACEILVKPRDGEAWVIEENPDTIEDIDFIPKVNSARSSKSYYNP